MKEKKAEKEKQKWETEKARILRDGTSRELLAVADRLTTQELQNAYNRLQAKQNIRNVQDTMFDRVDRAMNKLNKVNNWVNTVNNSAKWIKKLTGKEPEKKATNFATKSDIDSLKKSIEDSLKEAATRVDKKEEKKLNKEAKKEKKTWDKIINKFEESHPGETVETWNVQPEEVIREPITDASRLLPTIKKKKRKR